MDTITEMKLIKQIMDLEQQLKDSNSRIQEIDIEIETLKERINSISARNINFR